MQQINVDELKSHPMNEYYFDDMEGNKWKEFLESVKTSGIIEPIVITQDRIIVSGHQRVRACKELEIDSIMCEIRIYDDEDKIVKDLLETNIRQRGTIDGSAVKQGRRYIELERIYDINNGGKGGNRYKTIELTNNSEAVTQSDLAKINGVSVDTWNNYKKLTQLIPEIEDLIDTGIVTPTTALSIVKNMSSEEQEEFIESMDITKRITQREVQQYRNKIKQLESNQTKTVEKEIDKTDYSLLDKNKKLLSDIDNLKREVLKLSTVNKTLEESSKMSEKIANSYKELSEDYKKQSEEYVAVKSKIIDMGLEPDGEYNLYSAASEIAKLTNEIEEFLLDKLAPARYQSYMVSVKNSDVMRKNFINTLSMVKEWYESMLYYVTENNENEIYDVVDMEEN